MSGLSEEQRGELIGALREAGDVHPGWFIYAADHIAPVVARMIANAHARGAAEQAAKVEAVLGSPRLVGEVGSAVHHSLYGPPPVSGWGPMDDHRYSSAQDAATAALEAIRAALTSEGTDARIECHPYDDPCSERGLPCRNHGGVVTPAADTTDTLAKVRADVLREAADDLPWTDDVPGWLLHRADRIEAGDAQ